MKIPKTVRTYCRHCKRHTVHKLKLFKGGAPRVESKGQRKHVRKTKHGYGGKAKFPIKPKKQTKKPTFTGECSECKKKRYYGIPKRMKKIEFAS